MKASTKTNQLFRAIMLLSRGRYYTSRQLAEELNIELRTVYRYIEDLKASQFFIFEQRGKRLRLSRESIFWSGIFNSLFLNDKEAQALGPLLEEIDTQDNVLLTLRQKVRNINSNYIAPLDNDADSVVAKNCALLHQAIENHRVCVLRGYSSLHSDSKSDRLVEPFLFLGSKNDVRCFEIGSQKNKTFKVSRCESVEVFEESWLFEKKHKQMHTDIFHFSDENTTRVRLLLGNVAKTILLEEYPAAKAYLIPHPDGRWMLDADFCSMKGVGRFYLGLFEDIEIVDSPEFKEYLTDRIKTLTKQG